jgi:putative membrane protein
MTNALTQKEKIYNRWILALSVIIPIAVAVLFTIKIEIPGVERLGFLPPIYATINALTAVILILGVIQIKKGKRKSHENLMKTAIGLSATFLVMYVIYHMTSDSTPYGGEGTIRTVYFIILITHILLSIAIIPLVLISFVKALSQRFDKHKKIAKITFPIWLYVTITGVIVYIMISPYY